MEFYHGNQLLLVFKSSGIVGLVTIIALSIYCYVGWWVKDKLWGA